MNENSLESRARSGSSLAVHHGTGLIILRGQGMVASARPTWLPSMLPWNRQERGDVFYGLQVDGAGMATTMSPAMRSMLPHAWQTHLEAARDIPAGALLGSGSLTSDAAFVDYDADVLQWVASFTVVLEHKMGVSRPTWRSVVQRTRQGRFTGLQRAHIPLAA